MKEPCGCEITVDPKTQFETIVECEKHKMLWKDILKKTNKLIKKLKINEKQSKKLTKRR